MGKGKKKRKGVPESSGSSASIKKKMLVRTITPAVAGLLVAGILISIIAGIQISRLKNQVIQYSSQNASYQISEYFTKYMEVSKQLAADQGLIDYMEELQPGQKINESPRYSGMIATMTNMHNTDADNILVCWVADVDSSQCIEDSGYVSELGEWDITGRSWYDQVMDAKTTIVTEPYENSSTGEMVASIISPVFGKSGDIIGVAALDLSLNAVTEMMKAQKLGDTGFLLLMTQAGTIMFADDESLLQTSVLDSQIADNVKQGFSEEKYGTYTYKFQGHKNYGYMAQAGESQWVVLSGMPSLEYNMDLYKVIFSTILLFAIVIAVLCVLITKIAMSIVRPIHQLHKVADRIAQGDLEVDLHVDSDDEIGEVAVSIGRTVDRLKDYMQYIDEISEVLGEIAEGNLLYTLKYDYAGEFGKIKEALERISQTLTGTLKGINSSADQVTGGAGQIAQAAQALAEGATSQAASVDELLVTVKNIADQVRDNAEFARKAADRADEVKNNIEVSNEEMGQLVRAMEEINECSDAISEIISNIEEIADQTNLLSLNASIEAARAGEMGKGFAVVANEVGALSKESVVAVQKSTELIHNSMNAVKRGMDLVGETAQLLSKSVEGVVGLTGEMNEMAEIAKTQMVSLQEVEKGIDEIANVVNDNSAMAEESAAASQELSAQATTLNEMIGSFTI